MRILIILLKYGGYCNRFFQSLHYHGYAIENDIIFFNPTMIGLLRFNNKFYYFLDKVNNIFLRIISKLLKKFFKNNEICFYFNKNNYIKLVKGWDFRDYKLTTKYHKKLKEIYSFDESTLSKKAIFLIKYINKLRSRGKFIIGLHIRRKDYEKWNEGKYYFSDKFYNKLINELKIKYKKNNLEPFLFIVSDEKISRNFNYDYFRKGSWKDDQIILQNCNLIVGPPSTFTMWASYIAEIPLIQIYSKEDYDLDNQIICKG